MAKMVVENRWHKIKDRWAAIGVAFDKQQTKQTNKNDPPLLYSRL